MKTTLTWLLAVLPLYLVHGQSSDAGIVAGPEWFTGSVMLSNGREIRGLVKYNDKTDIVSIENGHEARSFTARHVKAFEFFDELVKKQRIFYSVEIEDRYYKASRPIFFEVLMDLDNFALISKISPIHLEKKEYATPALFNPVNGAFTGGRYYGYPSTISYTERLFLLSKDGELRPYLEITEKEIDGLFFDRTVSKNKVLDEDALRRFTGRFYKELAAYASDNNYDLKEKDGLMKALAYYRIISRDNK